MPVAPDNNSSSSSQWRKNNNATSCHARFSIVESNQFRELTHLSLTLSVGTDKTIRVYLSTRLSQAMAQMTNINNQLHLQKKRCDAAERNAIEANKKLGDIAQSYESERYQLQCQAEERFHAESNCRNAEINDVKTSKDLEIRALKDDLQKLKTAYEDKVRFLEESNRKTSQDKTKSENENERLASRLSQQETANELLTTELNSLRSRIECITGEKATTEKNLRELQVLLSSLQTSNGEHKNTISLSEAQIASTERVYADAKQTISRQHAQIDELQRCLASSEAETARYKELAGRYQTNRAEMKKKIKEKAETIREQEEAIRSRDNETADLKHRVERLSDDFKRLQVEKDAAMTELTDSKKKLEEDARKLENNQQVGGNFYSCCSLSCLQLTHTPPPDCNTDR
jgi:spindle assembly abnormal protein 6